MISKLSNIDLIYYIIIATGTNCAIVSLVMVLEGLLEPKTFNRRLRICAMFFTGAMFFALLAALIGALR